ncbi:MAG TPA: hypothetical protein VK789_16915 [Bryobacteraceae bacterium]|nr:hypothetical protein [Bryobacteraceae bacterium]
MPLQNRVTPAGELIRVDARGTFMGNRGGVLHNIDREIVRPYASRRWITCVLEFKGRRRTVMTPDRYTELFFLDEATALAAGHRPCAECRRERFNAFKEAWIHAANSPAPTFLYADDIDRELHRSRIDHRKGKVTYRARLSSLPDGAFVRIEDSNYLIWRGKLARWSPWGYLEKDQLPAGIAVEVLTPEQIVRCLRHGYKPEIHPSLRVHAAPAAFSR